MDEDLRVVFDAWRRLVVENYELRCLLIEKDAQDDQGRERPATAGQVPIRPDEGRRQFRDS